jgi:hypothetical protein
MKLFELVSVPGTPLSADFASVATAHRGTGMFQAVPCAEWQRRNRVRLGLTRIAGIYAGVADPVIVPLGDAALDKRRQCVPSSAQERSP